MDWIEQLFGIDPDMASGSLEILISGAVALVAKPFESGELEKLIARHHASPGPTG